MNADRTEQPDPARRALIRRAAVLGAAVAAGWPLAACGAGDRSVRAGAAAAPPEVPPGSIPPATADARRPAAEVRRAAAGPAPERAAASDRRGERSDKRADQGADPSAADGSDKGSGKGSGTGAGTGADKGSGKRSETASDDPTAEPKADPTKAPSKAKRPETEAPAQPTPSGPAVASTSEVPVGSGALFETDELIVTQPAANQFRGFSSFCTHEGCLVDVFEGNQMICTCHNTAFAIADGRVLYGPAKKPLPPVDIVVVDGQIFRSVPRR